MRITSTILLTFLSTNLLIAEVPNIGNIQKEITPKKEKPKKMSSLKIDGIKDYQAPMVVKNSKETILVKGFKIENAVHLDEEELQNLIASYNNKNLTYKEIFDVTKSITKEYRRQGYFVARAYLPVQNIHTNKNIVVISIIEGNYGEFILKNDSLVKDSIVQGMLDNVKSYNIVSSQTLERAMLNINDSLGVVVTQAEVLPGQKVGTSDFIVSTSPTQKRDGYIMLDNTGSRYTGKNRIMAGLNINSPFKRGDKLSLFALSSQEADLLNGRVSYLTPLMSNGLKGEIAYSQTNYSLIEEYNSLDAVGSSKIFEASIKYPLIRTRLKSLYASIKVTHKELDDKIRSTNDNTEKKINSINLALDYDKDYRIAKKASKTTASFSLTHGYLSFEDASKKAQDIAGANTNGNYSKVNLNISHKTIFTERVSLESSLKMQYTLGNKNLDGIEDMSIGGSSGVKLYPSGESSAENGYLFNIETKYKLPEFVGIRSSLGAFYDIGRVHMANNNVSYESKTLQDVGLGYYANYKDFFGKIQAAWKAGGVKVTSEPDRNIRVLCQAGMVF